jgi:Methylase involved in ubiquinone/menaquinone biosynthesis
MEAYRDFASVYDMFMDNIDYTAWSDYIVELLNKYGITDGQILELGCGTGTITELLANKGYEMIGLDNSSEMLSVATDKKSESGHDILYILQDMSEFELHRSVNAIISVCDSMNYILEENDLLKVFKQVNEYLDIDGVFIFDLNTIYKYEKMLGDNTFAENREDGSFIWENFYDEGTQINEYDLTLFIANEDGSYQKSEEVHSQRAYAIWQIKDLLKRVGLETVKVYDAFTFEEPKDDSERIYIIARK